jgi:hypothetical protein
MMDLTHLLGSWLATDAPALPATWGMRLYVSAGWALVLALLGASLGRGLPLGQRRLLAACLALWALLPGPLTPDYWLGLAFHGPSVTAMFLCGWGLWRCLWRDPVHPGGAVDLPAATAASGPWRTPVPSPWPGLVLPGLLLGYLLLLDTFAVLPLQLYAWGFSPALLPVLLALSLLPWLWRGPAMLRQGTPQWIVPAALLLFAATRLPTGNLWDALLDPWLWLVCNGWLVRHLYRKWRT